MNKAIKHYTRKATFRIIWIKKVSGIFHWISKSVGKRHGRKELPRHKDGEWHSTFIQRKTGMFHAFTHKEYVFCEKLLSDLRGEASKLLAELALMEEHANEKPPVQDNAISLSEQARYAQRMRMEREARTRRRSAAIVRLTEIHQIIECVEEIITQRCDKANQILRAHALAFWTGVLLTHPNADIAVNPVLPLTEASAQSDYVKRHQALSDEMREVIYTMENARPAYYAGNNKENAS